MLHCPHVSTINQSCYVPIEPCGFCPILAVAVNIWLKIPNQIIIIKMFTCPHCTNWYPHANLWKEISSQVINPLIALLYPSLLSKCWLWFTIVNVQLLPIRQNCPKISQPWAFHTNFLASFNVSVDNEFSPIMHLKYLISSSLSFQLCVFENPINIKWTGNVLLSKVRVCETSHFLQASKTVSHHMTWETEKKKKRKKKHNRSLKPCLNYMSFDAFFLIYHITYINWWGSCYPLPIFCIFFVSLLLQLKLHTASP